MDAWELARILPLGRSAGQSGRDRPDMVEGREVGLTPAPKPLNVLCGKRTTSPPPVEWPTWIALVRSSCATSVARSSAYVSMSLPCHGWLERPCLRRSLAMQRYQRVARHTI